MLVSVTPALAMGQPAGAATSTVVSLTFDDGIANQSVVPAMLDAHGMKGTFYVNTDQIGVGGFLSWANLTAYQADGHEIGGHTLDHPDLTTLPLEEAGRQVCQDRANLANHGIDATDFAYPYGTGFQFPSIVSIVQGCGYNSARRANGLFSAAPECTGGNGCGFPYSNLPANGEPYAVRTGDNVQSTMTLADIENLVTQAELHGGGYVPIVFHNICAACDPYSVTQANLQAFLDWLQPRSATGTIVQTVHQVMGGAVQPLDTTAPTSSIACNSTTCVAGYYNAPVSVTLSSTDTGSGVAAIRYTTNGTDPTSASTVYSAPITVSSTTTIKYSAWDYAGNQETVKSKVVQVDTTAPTTSIACNGAACHAAPYTPPMSVTLSSVDAGGSGLASIHYTTDNTDPTLSSPTYSAPLSLSVATTLKYRAFDVAGNAEATKTQVISIDTTAPVSSIACNGGPCGAGWYNAPTQISLAATDVGGGTVAAIRYTTDGSTPTPSSTAYSTPFTVSTATIIKYRATDSIGNVENTNTQPIQIDTIAPISSIACNNASCGAGWYNAPVQVSLAATDQGGSTVAGVHYTTDGSDPTLASPLYSAPFTVAKTTTVKYRAFDVASNAEVANSVLINVDAAAPVASMSCNGKACTTAWYHAAVRIAVSASDAGSGLASIHYTTDGTTPTLASPAYTAALKLTASRWIKVRAFDHAGNAGPVVANKVRIDHIAPAVVITSTSIRSQSNPSGNRTLKLSAKDIQSGISKFEIFVDGHLKATKRKGPFTYTWVGAHAKKGTHKLTIRVTDAAGNRSIRTIKVVVS